MDYKFVLRFVVLCMLCVSFITCTNSHSYPTDIVTIWQNKVIDIPEQIQWKTLGKDTICEECLKYPYKILVYIDSVGCTPCQFNASKWLDLMDSCDMERIDISYLFVLHSDDYKELEIEFMRHNFFYPVIYDKNNDFNNLNHFPPAPYRTFLLDKDNKVLLVGSPINNPKMWALYKKRMTQKQ